MPSKSKSKSKKHRHHTKISQKVIQKVVVQVNQEKKAKRARRKQKRAYKQEYEQPQGVPPTIVYNTGAAYAPPNFGATLIKPQPQLEYVTPVPLAQDNINSKLYSEPVYRRPEKVEGNYAFNEPDKYFERPNTSLYDNDLNLKETVQEQERQFVQDLLNAQQASAGKGIPDLMNITEEQMSLLTASEGIQRKRRSKHEIANARYEELKQIYIDRNYSPEQATQLANEIGRAHV